MSLPIIGRPQLSLVTATAQAVCHCGECHNLVVLPGFGMPVPCSACGATYVLTGLQAQATPQGVLCTVDFTATPRQRLPDSASATNGQGVEHG